VGFRGSRNAAVAVVLASFAAMPPVASADWPIYGHDLANSRDAGPDGPAAGDLGSLSQAWAFRSQTGDFTGTPVVADGVLVAGDHGGSVYALDAVSGQLLWSADVGHPVTGTAAIDVDAPGGAAVYVPVAELGGPRLVAFSLHDGRRRWDTRLTEQDGASVFGSPVHWSGTVYIGTSGPNNDDSTARGSVVAIDEATGAVRWQTFTVLPGHDGAAVWCTPAIDTTTGRLYVGTGNNYHEPTTDTEDAMLALDAATGGIVGLYQATAGDSFAADNATGGPDYDFGASPNLFEGPNGEKLVGEGQKSGIYWALDRATMQPVWHTMVGPGGYLGGILGSTAYDGEHIYGGDTLDGTVFSLARDGSIAWSSFDAGGVHLAASTVAHDVLYTVDPNGFLVARDPATGDTLTRLSLGGPSFGGVSAVGGALYVAMGTGPPPEPAPQVDGQGSIIAFGDTSRSGASPGGATSGRPSAGRRARIRLSVRPRRVRTHRLVRFHFRATSESRPLRRVKIRLAGRVMRTNRRGRAAASLRFERPGVRVVRASRRGLAPARARITVVGKR
jgi:polyvinyl alcohol dehydrogenase (cytochrome)